MLDLQKATKPLCLAVADMPDHAAHFADAELDLEADLENVLERELEEADVREFAAAHVREEQQRVDALLRTCVRMDDLPDGDLRDADAERDAVIDTGLGAFSEDMVVNHQRSPEARERWWER